MEVGRRWARFRGPEMACSAHGDPPAQAARPWRPASDGGPRNPASPRPSLPLGGARGRSETTCAEGRRRRPAPGGTAALGQRARRTGRGHRSTSAATGAAGTRRPGSRRTPMRSRSSAWSKSGVGRPNRSRANVASRRPPAPATGQVLGYAEVGANVGVLDADDPPAGRRRVATAQLAWTIRRLGRLEQVGHVADAELDVGDPRRGPPGARPSGGRSTAGHPGPSVSRASPGIRTRVLRTTRSAPRARDVPRAIHGC